MIEISRAKSAYVYRQNPANPLIIDRKENRHNARWYFYARRDTPREAKAALLALTETEQDE